MPRYSLPQNARDGSGFQGRDVIRFFMVDLILIIALRLLMGLGVFPTVDAYVLAILGSKVVLFLYLFWLIRDRRDAWPETGATGIGHWWTLPAGVLAYAAFYPALLFMNSFNRVMMIRLHAALGWVYNPQPQDVMVFIFEDILQTPVRILLIAFTVLLGPFMEELAFRGVGIDAYRRTGGVVWAVVWTSFLFGLYHFDLNLLLPLTCLGVLFGALRVATGTLWSALVAHCLHNIFTLLVMAHELALHKA
ncbi:MAG: CPBP family intramembrane metalloprotease [Planctomycetota bacterium]|nr:CPBP family intramembrane metalloprotease [Planctomycetota bacterium]